MKKWKCNRSSFYFFSASSHLACVLNLNRLKLNLFALVEVSKHHVWDYSSFMHFATHTRFITRPTDSLTMLADFKMIQVPHPAGGSKSDFQLDRVSDICSYLLLIFYQSQGSPVDTFRMITSSIFSNPFQHSSPPSHAVVSGERHNVKRMSQLLCEIALKARRKRRRQNEKTAGIFQLTTEGTSKSVSCWKKILSWQISALREIRLQNVSLCEVKTENSVDYKECIMI